uniref:Uncharacterized protein n=1 Tax=Meloidogyne enterolobii TaxID=390850 RepID=A0A6V7VUE7_MELEN|nr:unnamed protein product [Meloidogyne enterolobii]
MAFGLRNNNYYIELWTHKALIKNILNNEEKEFKLNKFIWKNENIFGCGLVYPPKEKVKEELPYVFFTQNGKRIDKKILIEGICKDYKPFVDLLCCSVETNFGKDLENKPFTYNIYEHLLKNKS